MFEGSLSDESLRSLTTILAMDDLKKLKINELPPEAPPAPFETYSETEIVRAVIPRQEETQNLSLVGLGFLPEQHPKPLPVAVNPLIQWIRKATKQTERQKTSIVKSGKPVDCWLPTTPYFAPAQEKSNPSQDSQPFLKACTVKNPQPCADKPPRPTYEPAPECSKEARKKKIESTLTLEVVVGTDGLVNDISVVNPAGYYGLEEAATKAVKTWRFKPGTSLGNPAPVQLRIEVNFRCQLL
jgi:TonB family protein